MSTRQSAGPGTPLRGKPSRHRFGGVATFRIHLLAAMALVVVVLTFCALYVAEQWVRAETQHDLQFAFSFELSLLRTVRDIRHSSLAERCRTLVLKPRIHAALEDNALDLLYPSAKDELGDALTPQEAADATATRNTIRPRFYRFLDVTGAVIPPLNSPEVGALSPGEEKQLSFDSVPKDQQNGYLVLSDGGIVEIIATPIFSTETGEAVAALVAGFPVVALEDRPAGLQSGIWLGDELYMASLDARTLSTLERQVTDAISHSGESAAKGLPIRVAGAEQMLFAERLNPNSLFPPAYEVGIFPLAGLLARQSELRWKAGLGGLLLLGLGIAASFSISAHLAAPVRELAEVSEENRVLRERAETALEIKRGELERSARFSADASHQLKTPVAILRAGLDELLTHPDLPADARDELSLLVHQTFRLTSIIEDLLLLSRLDSGRLQLDLVPLHLTHLIETCVDDIRLLYDAETMDVQLDLPPDIHIAGDSRYTILIIQNLLENAYKYGRPGSPIRVSAQETEHGIAVAVANRGEPISRVSSEHIFERFHRASMGGNIPGHGLGLNLARELARLHGGDLRLLRSDEEWTVFEARFRAARATASHSTEVLAEPRLPA